MQVNGRQLAVEIEGSGPPMLMVHGLGGTSNFYQPQAIELARRFTVIRVDCAGAGRSQVADGISIDTHADDLAAVLDCVADGPVVVVGHSMGTLVVQSLLRRHPFPVSKLVLLGAVAIPTEAGRRAQRDRAATLRAGGIVGVADGVVANALSSRTRAERPEVAAFVRELVMRQDPEGYARNCEALAAATDPGPIDRDVDLLLITGSEDRVGAPEVSRALAQTHGRADVVVIDGIGHWTAVEAASQVAASIAEFA